MKGQVIGKYTLLNRIGSGSFGQIFQCEHNKTKKQYAAKIESVNVKIPRLSFEIKLYKYFSGGNNIPKIYWYGNEQNMNIMVMDLLGKSLENLHEIHKTISLKSILMIIDQMISCIEFLHKMNFIHRDIKPDNFVMGINNESNKLYLLDFGLAKRYRDPLTLQHIKYSEGKSLTGTARYASVNALSGIEQSRRDDMEAAGYVWIYLLKGSLPWSGLCANVQQDKYSKICECKIHTSFEDLCSGLPIQFVRYFYSIRDLKFTDEPHYAEYRKMFRDLQMEYNYIYDGIFDWTLLNRKRKNILPIPSSPSSSAKAEIRKSDSPHSRNQSSNSLFSGTIASTKPFFHDSSSDNNLFINQCNDLKLRLNASDKKLNSDSSNDFQIDCGTEELYSKSNSSIASSTTSSSSFLKSNCSNSKSNLSNQFGSCDFLGIFQKIHNGEKNSSCNSIDLAGKDSNTYITSDFESTPISNLNVGKNENKTTIKNLHTAGNVAKTANSNGLTTEIIKNIAPCNDDK